MHADHGHRRQSPDQPAERWNERVNLLVFGTVSLSAAVTGAHEGKSVLVLEKTVPGHVGRLH